MTTTNAAPDACRGCAQPWRSGELFCSACGTARGGAAPARPTVEVRRPGFVLAAQIMIGLSALVDAIMLLVGLALLPVLGALGAGVVFAGVLGLALLLVYVIVQVRAVFGIERRQRSSRTAVTVLPVVDAAVTLVLLVPLGAQSIVGGMASVLVGLPWAAVVAGLLWLPYDSKRWFRDFAVPGLGGSGGPSRPHPADDGDWWAAEARRAASARNVPQSKSASRPRPVEPESRGRHARPTTSAPDPRSHPQPHQRARTAGPARPAAPPLPAVGSLPEAPSFPSGPSSPVPGHRR